LYEPQKGKTNMKKGKKPTYPDAEARRRKALERLGTDNPKCAHCLETDPIALELHHVGQKQYAEAVIIECRNHHAKLSNAQKDHPPRIDDNPPSTFERIGHLLLGLAELLRLAAARLDEIGRGLIDYAASLITKRTPAEGVAL
jgi:hypothetical protein